MEEDTKTCHHCKNSDTKMKTKMCSRCKIARYCSVNCQKEAWPTHKLECKPHEQNNQIVKAEGSEAKKIVKVENKQMPQNKAIFIYYTKYGIGCQMDEEKAEKLALDKSLEQNKLVQGMKAYYGWKTPPNEKKALKIFSEVIEKDKEMKNEETQYCLLYTALIYFVGDGVKQNTKKGIELLEKLVAMGNPGAMFELGCIYMNAKEGIKLDIKKAVDLFTKAMSFNHSMAIYNLAIVYHLEKGGTKRDIKKAIHYYEIAVSFNHPMAMTNLGFIYRGQEDDEIKPDLKKTIDLYTRAAELGNPQAMTNLGTMYEDGEGVKRDLKKAFEYYKKAAYMDYPDAIYKLKEIGIHIY